MQKYRCKSYEIFVLFGDNTKVKKIPSLINRYNLSLEIYINNCYVWSYMYKLLALLLNKVKNALPRLVKTLINLHHFGYFFILQKKLRIMTVVQYTQLDSTGNRNRFHWISSILFVGDLKKNIDHVF